MRRAISLFSGAGGDTLGLERAGFTVVAYSENNAAAIATHQAAFPNSVLLRDPATGTTDITKIPDSVFEPYAGNVELVFGGAPCFVAGTLVLTEEGYKPIETVGLTDRLLTHTGAFQPILNLQRKPFYTGALHHIQLDAHPRPIVCTPEHPFYVRCADGGHEWKIASGLTVGDYVGMVVESNPAVSNDTSDPIANELNNQRLEVAQSHKGSDYAWFAVKENHTSETVASTVYNFEVATDNSYIVENAVVHNCQGFSHAGKKRATDPRNELVHQMARALKIVKPRWMIFENVKGLLSRRGYDPFSETPEGQERPLRPVIQIIQEVFMRAGYMTSYRLVDVRAVGVPQLRKRLIVVGFRNSRFYPHIDWPTLPTDPTEMPTIRHILTPTLAGATPLTAEPPDPRFLIATTETAPTGTPHPNLLRLANGIRNLSSKERAEDPTADIQTVEPEGLISFGARSSAYHGEVMNPDAASKTIICTYNLCPRLFVGLHSTATDNRWVRCLTVPELGQIQGFPADFPWQGGEKEAIKQIGNAVPPALSEQIARALLQMRGLTTPQLPPGPAAADTDDEDDE
jgi:DNA (cytosine-5)-methyltransferase 1